MLDQKALKNLAVLARIDISDEELATFGTELSAILAFVDEIQSVQLPDTRGEFSIAVNVLREDSVAPLAADVDLIESAPLYQDRFVKVPKVMGE